MGELAMEAEIRGMGIGKLVGALILAVVKKDLLHLVSDDFDPHTYDSRGGAMPIPQTEENADALRFVPECQADSRGSLERADSD